MEDLETLRLFSRVIPEYCRSVFSNSLERVLTPILRNMDEADILDNSFSLIFAFDEIVALGYRESVNLAQIRTFVEMDSHEEKVGNVTKNLNSCFFPGVQCSETDPREGRQDKDEREGEGVAEVCQITILMAPSSIHYARITPVTLC